MKTKEERTDGVLVCSPEGEIDVNTAAEIKKVFEGILRNNEKKVLVDFSAISYIDSSGLAAFIEIGRNLKKTGGVLCFCNMDHKIRHVFEVTKLHKLFAIFESREAALKDF